MKHFLGIFLAAFALAGPAFAKLEIRNVQPAHGLLGPARAADNGPASLVVGAAASAPSSDIVYPLDEFFVRYQIAGVKADKDGKTDLEVAVRLTNADGKALIDVKGPVQKPLSLGGDVFQTFGVVNFPEKAPPGEYKLTVQVRDRMASETASFERKLTCKPPTFQILVPRFSHDVDGKIPAGTTVLIGDSLHYKIRVVGYDKSQKKVALVMKGLVLDADGKDIGAKPMIVNGDIADADKVAKSVQANFTGTVVLHRVGDFRIRITVEDAVAKKSTTFEVPLKVLAP